MRQFRVIAGAGAASIALIALAGCFFQPGSGPLQVPPSPNASGGPTDWASLPHCENGPPDPWVLVDDFPVDLIESAGLQGECGDLYLSPDLPPYVSIADSSVSLDELGAFAVALEAEGYVLTADTFVPMDDGDAPGKAGSWEYTLHGDDPDAVTLIYVINFWSGGERGTYFTFLDFESPTTRALG